MDVDLSCVLVRCAAHAGVCEELLESEHQVGELARDSLLRHLSAEQLDACSYLYELSAFWDVSVLQPHAELDAGAPRTCILRIR